MLQVFSDPLLGFVAHHPHRRGDPLVAGRCRWVGGGKAWQVGGSLDIKKCLSRLVREMMNWEISEIADDEPL